MDIKDLLPYISTLVVIIGWFFAYFSNKRTKRYEMFLAKTEINLKEISGPMINEMNIILRDQDKESRFQKLQSLIDNLGGVKSPLFLESSPEIIYRYNRLEQYFYQYQTEPNETNYEQLWTAFGQFYEKVLRKLEECHKVVFKSFDWNYRMERKNPFFRLLFESFRISYEFITGITQFSLLVCVLTLIEFVAHLVERTATQVLLVKYTSLIFPITAMIIILWLCFYGLNHAIFNYKKDWVKPKKPAEGFGSYTVDRIKKKYPYPTYDDAHDNQVTQPANDIQQPANSDQDEVKVS